MPSRPRRLGLALGATLLLLAATAQPLSAQAASGQAVVAQDAAVPPAPPPVFTPADLGFRFHGYVRSGFGVDGDGKGQQPFIAPLAGSKYRLGNEAETYLETTFSYGATSEGDNPAYFDTKITF